MKKYYPIIATAAVAFTTIVYMTMVEPSVSRPATLAGFFALLILFGAFASYSFLSFMHDLVRRVLWSVALAVYGIYLIALATLGSAAIPNLALATLVLAAILFVIDRSRSR